MKVTQFGDNPNRWVVDDDEGQRIGWVWDNGCANSACLRGYREGRPFHATPANTFVILDDYHFATVEDAAAAVQGMAYIAAESLIAVRTYESGDDEMIVRLPRQQGWRAGRIGDCEDLPVAHIDTGQRRGWIPADQIRHVRVLVDESRP